MNGAHRPTAARSIGDGDPEVGRREGIEMNGHGTRRARRTAMAAVAVAVGCSGPDFVNAPNNRDTGVEASAVLFGKVPEAPGFLMVLATSSGGDLSSKPIGSGGGTASFLELLPGSYLVRFESAASDCESEGDNPISADVVAEQRVALQFRVSCVGPDVTGLYVGAEPGGTNAGRFYLYEGGGFLWDRGSPTSEVEGTHSRTDSTIVFDFGAQDDAWRAVGTLHGPCMTLRSTFDLWMDYGLSDGEYCAMSPS